MISFLSVAVSLGTVRFFVYIFMLLIYSNVLWVALSIKLKKKITRRTIGAKG